eukprot:366147-Chlamydomonas_euryale.AAC.6
MRDAATVSAGAMNPPAPPPRRRRRRSAPYHRTGPLSSFQPTSPEHAVIPPRRHAAPLFDTCRQRTHPSCVRPAAPVCVRGVGLGRRGGRPSAHGPLCTARPGSRPKQPPPPQACGLTRLDTSLLSAPIYIQLHQRC